MLHFFKDLKSQKAVHYFYNTLDRDIKYSDQKKTGYSKVHLNLTIFITVIAEHFTVNLEKLLKKAFCKP